MIENLTPTLGLAICTYNRAELLQGLFESLLPTGAYGAPDKIVVVNNGPTQTSANIVTKYKERTVATYLREETPGLSAARNAAIAALQTDYILFFDDDVRLVASYFPELRKILEEHAPDIVAGPVAAQFNTKPPDWLPQDYVTRRKQGSSGRMIGGSASGGNFVVRRKIFDDIGGFQCNLGMKGKRLGFLEEFEFALRYRLAVKYTPSIYYAVECEVDHFTPKEKYHPLYLLKREYISHLQRGRLFRSTAANPRGLIIAGIVDLLAAPFSKYNDEQQDRVPLSRQILRMILSISGRIGFLIGSFLPIKINTLHHHQHRILHIALDERRAKKWNPVFRKTGATTKKTIASGDPDLSPDAIDERKCGHPTDFSVRGATLFVDLTRNVDLWRWREIHLYGDTRLKELAKLQRTAPGVIFRLHARSPRAFIAAALGWARLSTSIVVEKSMKDGTASPD